MTVSLDAFNTIQSLVKLPKELVEKLPIKITDLITGNQYVWDK